MNSDGEFLDLIKREHLGRAQNWWLLARICQIVILVGGIFFNLVDTFEVIWSFLATALALIFVGLEWRSEYLRRIGEALLRKYEYFDGLGWKISKRELSNLELQIPLSLKKRLEASPKELDEYYSSSSSSSPRRLIENLSESSWWTMHLAKRTAIYFLLFTVTLGLVSIVIAVFALWSDLDQVTSKSLSRGIVAVIAFLFTTGYVRRTVEYWQLYLEARLIEERASMMLDQSEIGVDEAVRLYQDYQFLRVSSPPTVTLVWRQMRVELNESWDKHRRN